MTHSNLLVELFVEELPQGPAKLGDAFASVLREQLATQGLTTADGRDRLRLPRRLAAHIGNAAGAAPTKPSRKSSCPWPWVLEADGPHPALLKNWPLWGPTPAVALSPARA